MFQQSPSDPSLGRAARYLTEAEIRKVITQSLTELEIIEWPIGNLTFMCSRRYLSIVRTGAQGGDRFEIHHGVLFAHDLAYMLDLVEIRQVGQNVRTIQK